MELGLDARAIVSGDPRWATFKQAVDECCHVKKGAKSALGIFYKPLEIDDDKSEDGKRLIPLLKTFHVFHASEIEGLPNIKRPRSRKRHGSGPKPSASSWVIPG